MKNKKEKTWKGKCAFALAQWKHDTFCGKKPFLKNKSNRERVKLVIFFYICVIMQKYNTIAGEAQGDEN